MKKDGGKKFPAFFVAVFMLQSCHLGKIKSFEENIFYCFANKVLFHLFINRYYSNKLKSTTMQLWRKCNLAK